MDKPITYIGLDVHKDTIAVALGEGGKRGEVREHGKIACRATIKVRTPDNQGEKAFCRLRRREGGARPEARAAEKLA